MSLRLFLFLVVCHQLCPPVHGRLWPMYRPYHRPVLIVPPPGYYHQPSYSRIGHAGVQPQTIGHLEAQRPRGAKDQKSPKQVQFEDDPMFNPGMYQGDIIGPLPDETAPLIMSNFIWKNGVIPFEIAPELGSKEREIIDAMTEIESKTCIRFKPRDPTSDIDYVHIFIGAGCSSSVGRRGGRQTLSLGRGCYSNGIIVHELMHAIGFYHLHQRHDRDDYLNIHWQNIQPSAIQNFKRMAPDDLRVDAVFDYDSVMLYGDTTFSADKVSKTMTPTVYGISLLPPAAKGGLSEVDVMSINRLYGCAGAPYIYGNRI